MSKINDGGPASPVEMSFSPGRPPQGLQTGNHTGWHEGMSLRDYFAGKALAGDWAAQSGDMGVFTNDVGDSALMERARTYYRMAAAMIKAREVQS